MKSETPYPSTSYSHETMAWAIFVLAKSGEIAAAVEILHLDPRSCELMASKMSVAKWEHGCPMDPNGKPSKVPDEYSFEHPCWQALWDYLPDDIQEKVNMHFEELGPS